MPKLNKKNIVTFILCLTLTLTALFYPSCTTDTPNDTDTDDTTATTAATDITDTADITNPTQNTDNTEQTPVKNPQKYYYYSDDFSDKQGPLWYYLSVPSGSAVYNELEYLDTEWGYSAWASTKGYMFELGFITENEFIPGFNNDAVMAFKVPYTGKLTLSSETDEVRLADSTGVSDGSTPSDGADFGVFLYSEGNIIKLYPKGEGSINSGMEFLENGETKPFEPIEIDVKKNEMIWIRSNSGANGRNDHDSIFFKPVIGYSSIDQDDEGVILTSGERVDRAAGSNLKADEFPMIAREFDDSTAVDISHENIMTEIENKTLLPGVYNIRQGESADTFGTIFIDGGQNIIYDFSGYKFIADSIRLKNCDNITIKNLTLEVKGNNYKPIMISADNCTNINIINAEIIDSYESDALAVVSFVNEDKNKPSGNIVIDGMRLVTKANSESPLGLYFSENENKNVTIKNSYIKGGGVNGSWVENNVIENAEIGIGLYDGGTAIYNTVKKIAGDSHAGIYVSGAYANENGEYSLDSRRENILAAFNVIDSVNDTGNNTAIYFYGVKNGVILLNEINGSVYVYNSENITVAENTFSSGDVNNLLLENVNYALGTNNKNLRLSTLYCENLSGEDFTEFKILEKGANEDMLPKLNKELFVNMNRKTSVDYGSGNTAPVNTYISSKYSSSKYIIVPPGAYSANSIVLSEYSDYTIYAYGVLCEFENYNFAVQMTDCESITLKGMYIDFAVPPNGQSVITDISDKTITFKMDEGYNQNLLDPSKYAVNDGQSSNIQWYKQGEKIVSNVATSKVTEVNAGNGEFSIPKSAFEKAKVGDKLGFRGRDVFVTYFNRCSNMKLEDVTMYGGGGFGFMERGGDKATVLNRLAIVPGPAPVLPDGSRGPARLMSTCDSTHSTNMRNGPKMTNCLFESATDDGTNINAEFGSVTDYDNATKTITYTNGNNTYSGLCIDFKIGDRVLLYTKGGELMCDATAVSDTSISDDKTTRTVQINTETELNLKANTIIQNASASGNGFSITNTRLYGNWTKGFLIKAIGGEISNCTFDSVGITAVYLCPEIKQGHWNECGYSENILIKDNIITNTGYMYSDDIYSTVINIRSDAGITSNPDYTMMKNITVTGNIISNRHTKYALNINGGNNVKVENNDWGYMSGKDETNDKQTAAIITTSKDIELQNNKYPPLSSPKINISDNSAVNIHGSDVE